MRLTHPQASPFTSGVLDKNLFFTGLNDEASARRKKPPPVHIEMRTGGGYT